MSGMFSFNSDFLIEQKSPVGSPRSEEKGILSRITIKNTTFNNRIVLSPMCMYSSEDGFFNDWHFVHLGQFAIRGLGLIFTEAAAVTPNGRITAYDAGIWKDEHIENLAKITNFIHKYKGKVGIQLAHAGRKSSTFPPFHDKYGQIAKESESGWKEVIGPSPISWDETYIQPKEMSIEQINKVVEAFKSAATRADKANFDVLEVHSAHGYLLHSFLSPLSNKRIDEYGGPFENRVRLLLEVIDAIKEVWPEEKPLFVRISCTDWVEGQESWDLDQSIKLSKILEQTGVDLVDCSSGGNAKVQKIEAKPLFQVKFSKEIKENLNGRMKVGAVGLILDVLSANKIVQEQSIDFVFMGRGLLRDPSFIFKASHEMKIPVFWPNQYQRAIPSPNHSAF